VSPASINAVRYSAARNEQPSHALNRHAQTLDVAEMRSLGGSDRGLDQNETAIYCRRLMQFCDTDLSRVTGDRHTPPPGLAFGEPDDRLREAIHATPSLRAQRSNPCRYRKKEWIASSLRSSQ
jgi:hypothetical protein